MGLFYYPMAIVFYLIGAIIGYHFFNYASKKSSKPIQIISLVVFSSYILAKSIVPQELHISNYLIETIVYTIAAFSLWNILDIFIEQIKPRANIFLHLIIDLLSIPLSARAAATIDEMATGTI